MSSFKKGMGFKWDGSNLKRTIVMRYMVLLKLSK